MKTTKVKYEIMTEDMNRDGVTEIVSRFFPSFSIVLQVGIWKDVKEDSISIVIIGYQSDEPCVNEMALEIKTLNRQQAILVAKSYVECILI